MGEAVFGSSNGRKRRGMRAISPIPFNLENGDDDDDDLVAAAGKGIRAISPIQYVLDDDDDVVDAGRGRTEILGRPSSTAGRRTTTKSSKSNNSVGSTNLHLWYPMKPLMTCSRPYPSSSSSSSLGNIPMILDRFATENRTDLRPPQKKLLENIHLVEKVVMEELRKLKTTPSANEALRAQKIRTLMSMR